jgi:cytochrome c biogenesis protein CcmG, thiol:disulfide interchange protein DsbE
MRRPWLIWLPLGLFAVFLVVASLGLTRPDSANQVVSRMIGEPFPSINLPAAASNVPGLTPADFGRGQAKLVNIFASWCLPCAAEAPQLAQIAQHGVVIEGVAIRDAQPDVDRFLQRYGNPFRHIGLDATSGVQFLLGSSGVPESFVVDRKGIIRYQHIGPINPGDVDMILAKMAEASR